MASKPLPALPQLKDPLKTTVLLGPTLFANVALKPSGAFGLVERLIVTEGRVAEKAEQGRKAMALMKAPPGGSAANCELE